MKPGIKKAFQGEMKAARSAYAARDWLSAFYHLERAHIVGQRYFVSHMSTHWWMLKVAVHRTDWREVRGQLMRMFAVVPGYVFGWVPKGNTGGANVSPLRAMPIPDDLREPLSGYSVARDMAGRAALLSVLVTLAWAGVFLRGVWVQAGETRIIKAAFNGTCVRLEGLNGAEDIVSDQVQRVAYAVGGDRRSFRGGGPGRAKIWAIPLDEPAGATRKDLAPPSPETFKSFGADLYPDPDGNHWLFVANRAEAHHAIEVFRLKPEGTFEHVRSITSPLLHNPNDLVVLGPDTLLVTLDKEADAGTLAEIMEGALERPTGKVLLISGKDSMIAADGLLMANGIALSPDGKQVFVGELVGQSVVVFDRDQRTNTLTRNRSIPVGTGVDNLTFADNGLLYIAGHPKLLSLALGYQRREDQPSPSEVVSLDPDTDHIERVFIDDGQQHAASSVALVDTVLDRIFIGSAFGPHVSVCDSEAAL